MIRNAQKEDLERILQIYRYARKFMAETGNPNQWGDKNPPADLLERDIEMERLYVIEEGGQIHGVFMFAIGEDPTYRKIEDGSWLSNTEYGVIHRIAGDGEVHGLLTRAVDWCGQKIRHLRIDTHEENKVMQHVILKNGFTRCGIIHIQDGSPRIAYERLW